MLLLSLKACLRTVLHVIVGKAQVSSLLTLKINVSVTARPDSVIVIKPAAPDPAAVCVIFRNV